MHRSRGSSGRRTHSADTNSWRIAPSICLGSPLISPRLHEDVEHFALGIDGAPEIHLPAADRDEHLVEVAMSNWAWVASRGDGRLHVSFLDVGQGDAAFIRLPRGSTILVDAGGLLAIGIAALKRPGNFSATCQEPVPPML